MNNVKELMRSGDYDAALAAVEPGLAGASRKESLTLKMRILMRSDRAAAEETIRALIAEGDASAEVHTNLATVLMTKGSHEAAIEAGQRALSIDPEALAARKRLITSLQRTRQNAEAHRIVLEGIARHPDDQSLIDLRSQIEAKLGPAAAAPAPATAPAVDAVADVAPVAEPNLPKRKKKKFMRSFGKR